MTNYCSFFGENKVVFPPHHSLHGTLDLPRDAVGAFQVGEHRAVDVGETTEVLLALLPVVGEEVALVGDDAQLVAVLGGGQGSKVEKVGVLALAGGVASHFGILDNNNKHTRSKITYFFRSRNPNLPVDPARQEEDKGDLGKVYLIHLAVDRSDARVRLATATSAFEKNHENLSTGYLASRFRTVRAYHLEYEKTCTKTVQFLFVMFRTRISKNEIMHSQIRPHREIMLYPVLLCLIF